MILTALTSKNSLRVGIATLPSSRHNYPKEFTPEV